MDRKRPACATKDSLSTLATSLLAASMSTSATAAMDPLACVAKEPFAPMFLALITATAHLVSPVIPSATAKTSTSAPDATDPSASVAKGRPVATL